MALGNIFILNFCKLTLTSFLVTIYGCGLCCKDKVLHMFGARMSPCLHREFSMEKMRCLYGPGDAFWNNDAIRPFSDYNTTPDYSWDKTATAFQFGTTAAHPDTKSLNAFTEEMTRCKSGDAVKALLFSAVCFLHVSNLRIMVHVPPPSHFALARNQ